MDLRDQLQTTPGAAYTLERQVVVPVLPAELTADVNVDHWKNADPDLSPQVADVNKRLTHLRDTEKHP